MTNLRKFRNTIVISAGLLILAGGLGCTSEKPAKPPAAEVVSDVPILTVQRTAVPDYYEAVGTVRAAQTSQLASQTMGTITSVSVHEGDRVRRGQVLAVVDETQPRAGFAGAQAGVNASQQEVAAAEADYALAQSTLQRYQGLFDKRSISPQEFDEVKTRFAAAQARLAGARAGKAQAEAAQAQARTNLDFSRIRAPFDGVVTAKLADVGMMAAPGTPVLVVEDPSRFRLEATVDEGTLGMVRLGDQVGVDLDALRGKDLQGKVVQIVPAADPSSRTFIVKIDLPRLPEIRSGIFGRARFARGQRDSILVPHTAVLSRGQLRGVYVVGADQVASLRYVTVGQSSGDSFEVLSGLENGERIVSRPGERELAGRKIEVK